jgi:hypothetical protein
MSHLPSFARLDIGKALMRQDGVQSMMGAQAPRQLRKKKCLQILPAIAAVAKLGCDRAGRVSAKSSAGAVWVRPDERYTHTLLAS